VFDGDMLRALGLSRPSGVRTDDTRRPGGLLGVRHVWMTRLVWLIAALIVVACVVFAAAQSG
jgi:hypothetical protein